MDLAEDLLQGHLFHQIQLHIDGFLAVPQLHGGIQQIPDIIYAAPDLRHATIHVQQGIHGLHTGPHGVLRGEDGVTGCLGKLAQEGEVHSAVGYDLGPISVGTGHEEGVDIGHHHRDGVGAIGGHVLDFALRHADVIQPLHADLLTGTLPHRLFHIVTGLIGEQGIHPHQTVILGLLAELRLAVDGPAHEPAGVLHGDDTAGDHLAGEGIPLADVLDIGDDALIQRLHRGAHPVGLLRIIAELVGMAEGGILSGDLAPHIPAAALLDLGVVGGGCVLAAHGGVLYAAAVGDEHQIVLRQVDGLVLAVPDDVDALGHLPMGGAVKLHVGHLHAEVELDAEALQILHHGQDHGLILVVFGKAQGGEVGQAADVMDIALDIELHLQSTVPVLEGEHGAPVQPEVAAEHLVVEEVADALVLQLLVGGEEQLHDLHGTLVGDIELAVGMGIFATVHRGPAQGIVGVGLVEPVVLVQHADALRLNGGDGVEQIPHDLEVVVHLTAAPHDVADVLEPPAVAGAAGSGTLLQNVDPLALHLAVTHQIAGGSQRRQAAAHDVGGFVVHALRLPGMGKGLIVTAGIIHKNALLSVDRCAAPSPSQHAHGRSAASRWYVFL